MSNCIECYKIIKTEKVYPCNSCKKPICEVCKIKLVKRHEDNKKNGSYFYACYTQTCDQCIWFDLG